MKHPTSQLQSFVLRILGLQEVLVRLARLLEPGNLHHGHHKFRPKRMGSPTVQQPWNSHSILYTSKKWDSYDEFSIGNTP